MANEEQCPSDFVVVLVLQGRRSHERRHGFVILLELRTLKIVFQEFCNDFVLGSTPA